MNDEGKENVGLLTVEAWFLRIPEKLKVKCFKEM